MPRWNGTTKQRGYGSGHQAIRKAYQASYRPGQPCAEGCGEPLTGPADSHDLAHDHVNGGYKGLAHAACNRAEGSSRGNRMQPRSIAAMGGDTRCKTCGKTYHYAAKLCEVCGVHYHPSGGAVRTCSRACGVQLRRRMYNGKLSSVSRRRTCDCPTGSPHKCFSRIPYRNCATCGAVFVGRGRTLTCSAECHAKQEAATLLRYREDNRDKIRAANRAKNDRLGEARGWPRGKGVYNVGKEPWNKTASRNW